MKQPTNKLKTPSNNPTFALSAPTSVCEYVTYSRTYQLMKIIWFFVGGFVEGNFLFLVGEQLD